MKKAAQKIVLVLLSLFMLFPVMLPGHAISTRASHYFAVTEAWATALGKGKILVEFDMGTTHIMTELGVTQILIKEKQSDGAYDTVKTYTRYNTSGLIDTNDACSGGSVTYYGTSGKKYYAIVTFYAKDSDGSETMYHATNTVTA